MDTLREKIERHSGVIGSLKTYMEQVKVKGTASDIVSEANSLKTRSDELVNVEAKHIEQSTNKLGFIEIRFGKVSAIMRAGSNIVG